MGIIEVKEASREQVIQMRETYKTAFEHTPDKKWALACALAIESMIAEHPDANPFSEEMASQTRKHMKQTIDFLVDFRLKDLNEMFAEIIN